MSEYRPVSPGSCCADAWYGSPSDWTYDVDGETCYVYTTCESCGAAHRDVFQYTHTEREGGG